MDERMRELMSSMDRKLDNVTQELVAIRGDVNNLDTDLKALRVKVVGGGDERPISIRLDDAEKELRVLKDRDESQRLDRRAVTADAAQWLVAIVVAAVIGAAITILVTAMVA
jgi:predicted  nucleic acid-binding Zn-ribbon protein